MDAGLAITFVRACSRRERTGAGVPLGATTMIQVSASMPL